MSSPDSHATSLSPPHLIRGQTPSHSSLNSNAETFHSFLPELDHPPPKPTSQPDMTSAEMVRTDSGYATADTLPSTYDRRSPSASTTSSSRRSPKTRNTSSPRHSTSSTRRPVPKRASRSVPIASKSPSRRGSLQSRPGVQSRYTTDSLKNQPHTHQFFQFPSFFLLGSDSAPIHPHPLPSMTDSESASASTPASTPAPPPPQQLQSNLTQPIYWTSPATRRLEYEAIDAYSNGIKGFLVKLLPDCFLPLEFRSTWRSRFHEDESGDGDGDGGSVRRYRIGVEEEEKTGVKDGDRREGERTGAVRRVLGLGKR